MIVENHVIKQVHLTEYQKDELRWRRQEKWWFHFFALWSLGFGVSIGLLLFR